MLILMDASKDQIAEAHRRYVLGIDDAQLRLRQHLSATNGPEPDVSVESLEAIGKWFIERIHEPQVVAPSPAWLPAWWNPKAPLRDSGEPGAAPFTQEHLCVIDELHAYVAEVLFEAVPTARWVIYKGRKSDVRNGSTVIQLDRRTQTYPLSLVYKAALTEILREGIEVTRFFDAVTERIATASG